VPSDPVATASLQPMIGIHWVHNRRNPSSVNDSDLGGRRTVTWLRPSWPPNGRLRGVGFLDFRKDGISAADSSSRSVWTVSPQHLAQQQSQLVTVAVCCRPGKLYFSVRYVTTSPVTTCLWLYSVSFAWHSMLYVQNCRGLVSWRCGLLVLMFTDRPTTAG
jgi:hypothetical protein